MAKSAAAIHGGRECAGARPLERGGNAPSAIHFKTSSRSRADCQRASEFFARQRRISRSRAGGDSGSSVEIAAGSEVRMAAMMLAGFAPSNAARPVSIS